MPRVTLSAPGMVTKPEPYVTGMPVKPVESWVKKEQMKNATENFDFEKRIRQQCEQERIAALKAWRDSAGTEEECVIMDYLMNAPEFKLDKECPDEQKRYPLVPSGM